jgi:two-component system chemotaxis response regulator CheB
MPLSGAVNDAVAAPGHAYVAPKDAHLVLDGRIMRFTHEGPVCGHRPSGTVLFDSIARGVGPHAIGVILTGMGDDGAEGLRAMSRAGAYTIAEDETTAVVYGMPGAAVRLGAAREVLPRHRIASRLNELAPKQRELAS